ncbi:MAG TPA: DUF1028 domain-containing protein [Candidatus Limnocylindria bacterium]|nr:DUF1028 domain-containing protein [Candidatus Limnocylindria bacterium]
MTYSIVALDRATGELGVAVQTRWFNVGAICSWVEPGVGAVATQSFVEPAYGPRTLARLREGLGPEEALARQLAADEGREVRQVGVVDAQGRTATHTGAACVAAALHAVGDAVSCQANMMARDTVPAAMLAAYESSTGDLPDRLLAALVAAEAEAGDIRGRQSAVLLVAPGAGSAIAAPGVPVAGSEAMESWRRRVDLRVDDDSAPLEELARLLRFARGQEALDRADTREAAGDQAGVLQAYRDAARLVPEDDQIAWMTGLRLLDAGFEAEALPELRRAVAAVPTWPEHLRRTAEAGHVPMDSFHRVARLLG